MSGRTVVRTRPLPPRRELGGRLTMVLLVAVAVSAGGTFAVRLADHLEGPPMIATIGIRNPSDLLIDVDVTGKSEDGWVPVGIARPQQVTVTENVVDQGKVWLSRFRAAGHEGGRLRVDRDQLARAGWTVVIPAHVIDELRDAGATGTAGTF